jgi:heme O synthase-like polyprenyltransferase
VGVEVEVGGSVAVTVAAVVGVAVGWGVTVIVAVIVGVRVGAGAALQALRSRNKREKMMNFFMYSPLVLL